MPARQPRPLTPAGSHYTFGYYDRCPWSPDLRQHLAIRIPQQEQLPQPEEAADIALIDTASGAIRHIGSTLAWNHQQGAMTQWLRSEPGHLVVNDREGDRVFSKVLDQDGRLVRVLPRGIYALDPAGRRAACLDFSRIQRRGYSYAVTNAIETGAAPLPADDGLWVMDLATGCSRLIASYQQMAAIHPEREDLESGAFVWLNHAIWNGDGSRLMVLFRYVVGGDPLAGQGKIHWKTFLYTMDADGGNLRCPFPHSEWSRLRVTHQEWGRTPDELLVDGLAGEQKGFVVFRDVEQPDYRVVAPGSGRTGHQNFSPDQRWVVSDTYDIDGYQEVMIADVLSGEARELARMRHPPLRGPERDWRCDLHPRWRPDGRALSIDSIDDGWRRIYLIEL